jgi:hypothetical protein
MDKSPPNINKVRKPIDELRCSVPQPRPCHKHNRTMPPRSCAEKELSTVWLDCVVMLLLLLLLGAWCLLLLPPPLMLLLLQPLG